MKKFIRWIHRADLTNCPFCGAGAGEDEREARKVRVAVYACEMYGFSLGEQYAVKCGDCGASLSRASEDFAVEAWNTRA